MLHSERLKWLRLNAKLTQEDVANSIGTSRTNYVRYERGNHQPPNDTLNALADLFNVSTDYLLGRTDDPVNYENSDFTADAYGPLYNELLKKHNGDAISAGREYVAIKQAETTDALHINVTGTEHRHIREIIPLDTSNIPEEYLQKKEPPPVTTEEALRKYFFDKLGREPSEDELRRLDDFAETFIKGLDK